MIAVDQHEIDELERRIQEHEIVLKGLRFDLQQLRGQKRANALEAFWEANPGPRINEGDLLMVTAEWAAIDKRDNGLTGVKEGEIIKAGRWEGDSFRYYEAGFSGNWNVTRGGVPLAHMRAMRQAYLDKHPSDLTPRLNPLTL